MNCESALVPQIPERKTVQIDLKDLPTDAPELVLAEKLAEYTEILEKKLGGAGNKAKGFGRLVSIALQKRLLSSVEAFARTLAVHRKNAAKSIAAVIPKATEPPIALSLFSEDNDEDIPDEQLAESEDVEVARATLAGASAEDDARAKKLLDEMTAIAEASRDRPDAKFRSLLNWMREHQCSDLPQLGQKTKSHLTWSPTRVLIFTEYSDTKNYLIHQLNAALGESETGNRVKVIHGGMDEEDREEVKTAFNSPDHPIRILVATDAAREGVNLQAHCHNLFHYDLPWNPGRMEQRNGRIDRMLQPSKIVWCHYFVYAQRPEDAVLEALAKKSVTIHEELGSLADVIDQRLARTLKDGIKRKDARAMALLIEGADPESAIERSDAVKEELEAARDKEVGAQLDGLDTLYQKAKDHLNLTSERLRDVVNLGLSLTGAPPLAPQTDPPGSYGVRDLEKMGSSDPTWREILDTLRHPRPRKMKPWDWRAQMPPRPVSFEPATTLSSETVQLHLQHRLTQKALAQFRAQAFSEDKLSRVTVVFDPTYARKRVLALGRLSLYGSGAARLHEEIIATAAFWVEGTDKDRLEPFATPEAEEKAVASLGAVLSRKDQQAIPEHIVSMLMKSATADEGILWQKLQTKAVESKLLRAGTASRAR